MSTNHGSAGFCTDHAQQTARPTTSEGQCPPGCREADGHGHVGPYAVPWRTASKPPTTVETLNRLLGIDIWTVRSFRADVRIDFREDGSVISVRLLNEHRPDRPTTVAEAVKMGARALHAFSHQCPVGFDLKAHGPDVASNFYDQAAAVLTAVGYADLLAEVERLRGSADAWWTEYDKELTETGRLQRIIDGYDRTPAEQRAAAAEAEVERANAVADSMQHFADVAERVERRNNELRSERDALAATVARVEALAADNRRHGFATGWHSQVHTVVGWDDLRAALAGEPS